MASYISDELYHFVGRRFPNDHELNYTNLSRLLRLGWVAHPPFDAAWGDISIKYDYGRTLESEELVVPTVTCFCDIPFELLHVHIGKYGAFGVSFRREFLVSRGARPVI